MKKQDLIFLVFCLTMVILSAIMISITQSPKVGDKLGEGSALDYRHEIFEENLNGAIYCTIKWYDGGGGAFSHGIELKKEEICNENFFRQRIDALERGDE